MKIFTAILFLIARDGKQLRRPSQLSKCFFKVHVKEHHSLLNNHELSRHEKMRTKQVPMTKYIELRTLSH